MSEELIELIMLPLLSVNPTLLHLDNRFSSGENKKTLGLGLQAILFIMPLLALLLGS
jgi:hypothetical protein